MKDSDKTKEQLINELGEARQRIIELEVAETKHKRIKEDLVYRDHLLANVSDAIIATDDQFTLTAWNQAAKRMYGWKEEEVLGRPVQEVLPSGFSDRQQARVLRTLAETDYFRVDVVQHHKDGTPINVEGTTIVLRSDDGRIAGYVSVNRDITDLVRTRQALEKERREFDTILDIAPVMIAYKSKDDHFMKVNSAFVEFVGLSKEEIIGKTTFDLVKQHDVAQRGRDHDLEVIRTGKPVLNQLVKWSGFLSQKKIWALYSKLPLHDPDGSIIGTVSFVQDIDDRVRMEEALRENEENLRITLNSIGDAVISTDTDSNITRMNTVAETMTGWKKKETLGKPLTDVFYIINDQTQEPVENPVEKVLKANKIVGLVNHSLLIAQDGTKYQIADSGAPIRNDEGGITGVVLVFRDVTEQLRTEQELLKVKKLESVGVLAGGIAHDFNNLLTGLFGNIEMAKMFLSADHKSYKFLESAGRSMDSAVNLTTQLLTFAKGGDPIKEILSIGEVITDTAKFSIRGSKAKLQTYITPDLWLVEADKGQLSQVISNLVLNAEQAMPTGGTITIAAANVETSEGRYVQITVQDEGVGIVSQYLDKIFDPYFTTKQKGSGLGLATTHSIISKHNGQITVDSHLNQGTIFTIHLPVAEKTEEKTTAKPSTEAFTTAASTAWILVMDDEEVVRKVIGGMLDRLGYQVSYAIDGQEAIAKYRASYENGPAYDVVITDLTIPGGMGGQAAAQEILSINPQAKIVISSGYATDPVMANYKMYGFKGVAVKPYRFADLQKVLQQVLEM